MAPTTTDTLQSILLPLILGLGGLGGVAALVQAIASRRAGIKGGERDARVNALRELEAVITQLRADLSATRAEVTTLTSAAEQRRRQIRQQGEYIAVLRRHAIDHGLTPPDPPDLPI